MSNIIFDSVEYKQECCEPAIITLKNQSPLKTKICCTDDCPFPCCLEELKFWEQELIKNWKTIESIISWLEIGMPMDKTCAWHGVEISDAKRWHEKRKKILYKAHIYEGFQPFVNHIF